MKTHFEREACALCVLWPSESDPGIQYEGQKAVQVGVSVPCASFLELQWKELDQ